MSSNSQPATVRSTLSARKTPLCGERRGHGRGKVSSSNRPLAVHAGWTCREMLRTALHPSDRSSGEASVFRGTTSSCPPFPRFHLAIHKKEGGGGACRIFLIVHLLEKGTGQRMDAWVMIKTSEPRCGPPLATPRPSLF